MEALVVGALLVLASPSPGEADRPGPRPLPGVEVAIRREASGLTVLPVEIAGRSLRFALDTGTSRTLVGARLAGQLGLVPVGRFRLDSAGGSNQAGLCGQPSSLRIAGILVELDCLGWLPDEPVLAGGEEVDGLLGADALAGLDLWLDTGRGLARIAPGGSLSSWTDGERIPLETVGRRPAIRAAPIGLGSREPATRLVLDSGCEDLILFGERASSARRASSVRSRLGRLEGAGASRSVSILPGGGVNVGGVHYPVAWTALLPDVTERAEDGLLALRVLEPVLIDLAGGVLVARSRLRAPAG